MNRIKQVDCIRGLLLVIMTLDHLQYMPFKRLSEYTLNWTYQTFGFVAAVEGFVFVSGLIFGLVYTPKFLHDRAGFNQLVWRRIRLIYFFHVGTFVVLAALFAWPWFARAWTHEWDNIALLQTQPWWTLLKGAAFLYLPSYQDILPMYLWFLVLSPWVLRLIDAGKLKWVAAASVALYLIGQLHPQLLLAQKVAARGFYLGWFEWLSWQLLFFVGVLFGYYRARNPDFVVPVKTAWVVVAIAVALPLLWYRHQFSLPSAPLPFDNLWRDTNLGVMRLVNMTALAYLLYCLCQVRANWFTWRWLRKLGEQPLLVFSFHVVLCYALNPLRGWLGGLTLWAESALLIVATASLWLPVMVRDFYRRRF